MIHTYKSTTVINMFLFTHYLLQIHTFPGMLLRVFLVPVCVAAFGFLRGVFALQQLVTLSAYDFLQQLPLHAAGFAYRLEYLALS